MDKDELLKKFHKSLNKHLADKIDETIKSGIKSKPSDILLAIGNPDGPPTWKGAKPSHIAFDEVFDGWKEIGYVNDAAIQWENVKADVLNDIKGMYAKLAVEAPMALEYTHIGPPPTQKCYFGIKDVNGKEVKIPVIGIPEFTSEFKVYTDAPEISIDHAGIEVETVYVEYDNGSGINVFKGPFVVKDQYYKPPMLPAPPIPTKVKIAESIQLEHNGQLFNLKPGDTFTLNYHVNVDGIPGFKAYDHNETVKILSFQYQDEPKPSPFLLNTEEDKKRARTADSLRVKQHKERGTWHFDWVEQLECFIIGGHYGKKRYEIVLGSPIPMGMAMGEALGIEGPIPNALNNLIQQCNKALLERISEKNQVFKHPKLHEIHVTCPGFGKPLRTGAWDGHNPICDRPSASLYEMIQHINDAHRWTREAIAEWIDTLDEQPVFYPVIESERMANSAKVVALESAVQEGTKD